MEKSFSLSEISNALPITPSNSLEEVSIDPKLSLPFFLEAVLEKPDEVTELELFKDNDKISVKLSPRSGLTWNVQVAENLDGLPEGLPTEEYVLQLNDVDDGFHVPSLFVKLVDNENEDVLKVLEEIPDDVRNVLCHLLETAEITTTVAYNGERPVGFALSRSDAGQSIIFFLYIRKSMRRRGLAKALIVETGRLAKIQGLSQLRVFTAPLGSPIFRRLGFQKAAEWKACLLDMKTNCLTGFLFGVKPVFDSRGYVELEFELMKKYEGVEGFETCREGSVAAFKYPSVVRQTYGVRTQSELMSVFDFMGDEEFKLFYEPGLVPESLEDVPSLLIREMRLRICDFDFSARVSCDSMVLKIAENTEDFELISDVFQDVYNIPRNCSMKHCQSAIYATKVLALIDGVAAACAFLEPVDTLCKVSYLQVSPNFRRRNVATAIMYFAVGVADKLGCEELFLRSMPDAEPLYKKLGFSYVKDWHRVILNPKY